MKLNRKQFFRELGDITAVLSKYKKLFLYGVDPIEREGSKINLVRSGGLVPVSSLPIPVLALSCVVLTECSLVTSSQEEAPCDKLFINI
jgi:hypothetical protein